MNVIRIFIVAAATVVALVGNVADAQVRINIVRGGETVVKTEPVDDLLFTVEYRARFVEDTTKRDKPLEEMMLLEVGSKLSLYHSYGKMVVDSIVAANIAAGASMESIAEKINGLSNAISYKIFKNYPSGKVTTLDQISSDKYRCEEENERPQWEILQDTAMVLSYACQKATCTFKGRFYTAWFTTEIARSEGPWKLHGLPGLIMKASDSKGEYDFECVALVKKDGQIRYGAGGYEPITRKNLSRQAERYAADPIGYVTSSNPNMKITVKNSTGEQIRPMNTPYNPIELAE